MLITPGMVNLLLSLDLILFKQLFDNSWYMHCHTVATIRGCGIRIRLWEYSYMKERENAMSDIVLVAETGSDIPADVANKLDIQLVPMHVSMGGQVLDDGTFPPEEVCAYYDKTGILPKTSGSSPGDFIKVFDAIHKRWPKKKILHLAYSAVTTCSYRSAIIAAEDRDYVASIDTKQVSAGQYAVVTQMAETLSKTPNMTLDDAVEAAKQLCKRVRMCFLPDDLEYLRAGGRVSNATCLVGRLLSIHPLIEILDGHLIGTKKSRGSMEKLVPALIRSYSEEHNLSRKNLWMIRTIGLSDSVCKAAEDAAADLKYRKLTWIHPGCVITTHGGPGAFGMVGVCT